MIRLSGIKLHIDEDLDKLPVLISKKLKINENKIKSYKIFKESIDARRRGKIEFVYTVDVEVSDEDKLLKKIKGISKTPDLNYHYPKCGDVKLKHRPIIIGFGPAGMFAGLILAEKGYKPLILERGDNVDSRTKTVETFWNNGKLSEESNVQFGEGGAGTFSDGKLTTRIKDIRVRKVLEELISSGSPSEIAYSFKPHVGTDILKEVVKNIREKIISLGGEVRFNSKVTDLIINNDNIEAVVVNNNETINTNNVILAIGHSSRDTFELLYDRQVKIIQKPFAIGVRIEHPQGIINKSQYKEFANHERLGAADYRLTYQCGNGRAAYTFCMCPGGSVVAAASENGRVVTNGMSEHARDKENANSALLISVTPEDYESEHPLAGMYFQRKWEEKAYKLGGSNYYAPIQLVGDFLNGKKSENLGSVNPSYTPGITLSNIENCLPKYVTESMKEALVYFDKKIKGFGMNDALITGVETRSSSPIRIVRDNETLESENVKGLYPAGEGAGYAGGIVSSAVDGIKIAEKIINKYKPLNI